MKVENIPLDNIDLGIVYARKSSINVGIEELALNIKALGLVQPITVYQNSKDKRYVILDGQRRFNAHHFLNEKYPNEGFDKIQTVVIPEPETDEEKLAISLASNTESLEMKRMDIVDAVNELWNKYNDYKIISEKLGISKYMIKKFVGLGRLPQEIKDAINQGAIHSNSTTAENCAIKAVDASGWEPGNDVDVNMVIEFAKELAKPDVYRKKKKHKSKVIKIILSKPVFDKLKEYADNHAISLEEAILEEGKTYELSYLIQDIKKGSRIKIERARPGHGEPLTDEDGNELVGVKVLDPDS